jgi:hypothetical protein
MYHSRAMIVTSSRYAVPYKVPENDQNSPLNVGYYGGTILRMGVQGTLWVQDSYVKKTFSSPVVGLPYLHYPTIYLAFFYLCEFSFCTRILVFAPSLYVLSKDRYVHHMGSPQIPNYIGVTNMRSLRVISGILRPWYGVFLHISLDIDLELV